MVRSGRTRGGGNLLQDVWAQAPAGSGKPPEGEGALSARVPGLRRVLRRSAGGHTSPRPPGAPGCLFPGPRDALRALRRVRSGSGNVSPVALLGQDGARVEVRGEGGARLEPGAARGRGASRAPGVRLLGAERAQESHLLPRKGREARP